MVPFGLSYFGSALTSLSIFLSLPWSSSAQTCYFPDGTADNSRVGSSPCDPTAKYSTCCGNRDYCLSNGLCLDAYGDNFLSIQTCTDPTWNSSSCTPIFSKETITSLQSSSGSFVHVFRCGGVELGSGYSESVCCTLGESCCGSGLEANATIGQIVLRSFVSDTLAASTVPAVMTVAPSSAVESTSSISPSSDASISAAPTLPNKSSTASPSEPSDPAQKHKSNALVLGLSIGLGVPLGLVLLAFLFLLRWQRRRNRLYGRGTANTELLSNPAIAQTSQRVPAETMSQKILHGMLSPERQAAAASETLPRYETPSPTSSRVNGLQGLWGPPN